MPRLPGWLWRAAVHSASLSSEARTPPVPHDRHQPPQGYAPSCHVPSHQEQNVRAREPSVSPDKCGSTSVMSVAFQADIKLW